MPRQWEHHSGRPVRRLGLEVGLITSLAIGVMLSGVCSAQEIVTNESVLAMVKAGLADAVIVAKIQSSQTRFDLSTDTLIALKRAGVSDRVLEAMTSRSAGAVASAPPPPAAAGGLMLPPVPREGLALYHVLAGKFIEMRPVAGQIESTFAPFFGKQELVIPSRRSEYRISENQPVFQAANYPPEAQLVRLRPGSKDDRNLKMLKMPVFGGTMSHGPDQDAVLKVSMDRNPDGWVVIRPNAPLAAGEYGFVLGQRIWDFGVD